MSYESFISKYELKLNNQQERAVRTIQGPVLLLAVPGSGKTTVMVARTGYMILEHNIPPENILAMTYTRAATHDMHKRFVSKFGRELGRSMSFKTINSVSNSILKYYCEIRGKKQPQLIEERERINILTRILCSTDNDYPTESALLQASTAITYIKNMMLSSDEIKKYKTDINNLSTVYQRYLQELWAAGCMDFDDQMVYAINILEENQDICDYFSNKYKYICVDEAQDTSYLQHMLIRKLAEQHQNIFMVGDEDQSIYAFRAAYPQALTEFPETYDGAQVLFMEYNYRSTSAIVDRASAFISQNKNRYPKGFISVRGAGTPPQLIQVNSIYAQYRYLLAVTKFPAWNSAVLYRENDSAIPLIDLLLRNERLFQTKNLTTSFFSSRAVQDMINILTLAIDPHNTTAFMRIYYKLGLFLSRKDAEDIVALSQKKNIPVISALKKYKAASIREKNNFKLIIKVFAELQEMEISTQALKYLRKQLRFLWDTPSDQNKINVLLTLSYQEPTIKGLINRIEFLHTLFTENPNLGDDGITLTTVHSSKGLEFDTVYLLDTYNGVFPCTTEESPIEEIMEERRLFYVAITRAKNRLVAFQIENRPSSFLAEIFPEEYSLD